MYDAPHRLFALLTGHTCFYHISHRERKKITKQTWLGSWYECSVWGPTCDSMDCISKTAKLPQLDIGDWLFFEEMVRACFHD